MYNLKPFFTLFFFLLTFSITAQSVVGDWQMSVTNPEGQTMTIKLSISEGSSFTVDLGNDGSIDVNGEYQLEGDQMTIKGVSGPAVQCQEAGIYKVEITADTLKMTRVSDPCQERGGPEGVMEFKRA